MLQAIEDLKLDYNICERENALKKLMAEDYSPPPTDNAQQFSNHCNRNNEEQKNMHPFMVEHSQVLPSPSIIYYNKMPNNLMHSQNNQFIAFPPILQLEYNYQHLLQYNKQQQYLQQNSHIQQYRSNLKLKQLQDKQLINLKANIIAPKTTDSNTNNFHKKYPMRSYQDFTVVPKIKSSDDLTTNNNGTIQSAANGLIEPNINHLKIGPNFNFKSDLQKIIEKFELAFVYLQNLCDQRICVELLIFKQIDSLKMDYLPPTNYLNDLIKYWKHFETYLKTEFQLVVLLFVKLNEVEGKYNDAYQKRTASILTDFHDVFLKYINLNKLDIIKIDTLRIYTKPDEIIEIMNVIDELILVIRCVQTHLWILMTFIKYNKPIVSETSSRDNPRNVGC